MNPVTGMRKNFDFGAPRGLEDEVGTLPCRVEIEGGVRNTYSVWKPSQEEIDYIVAGGLIELGIHGAWPIPPVSLNVTDEVECLDVCEECGLPQPGSHRGTCSHSMMRGGTKPQLSSEDADAANGGVKR